MKNSSKAGLPKNFKKPKKLSGNCKSLTINKKQVIDVLDNYLHATSLINDNQHLYSFTENPYFPDEVYLHIEEGKEKLS